MGALTQDPDWPKYGCFDFHPNVELQRVTQNSINLHDALKWHRSLYLTK